MFSILLSLRSGWSFCSENANLRGEDYVHSHWWSAYAGYLFFIACTSCLLSFCRSEDHEEGEIEKSGNGKASTRSKCGCAVCFWTEFHCESGSQIWIDTEFEWMRYLNFEPYRGIYIYRIWLVVSNIFYFYPDPWGNDPIWQSYFSNGLVQAPTRYLCPWSTWNLNPTQISYPWGRGWWM